MTTTTTVTCPFCGVAVTVDDVTAGVAQAEVEHMNTTHPDIVAQRLTDAGFARQPDGSWLDTKATAE